MTLKELFDFVVDPTINQENIEVSVEIFRVLTICARANIWIKRTTWTEWLN